MGSNLLINYVEFATIVLFGIGFSNLLFNQNLIKKCIGFNIMDSSIFLFLAAKGYVKGKVPAIVINGVLAPETYSNPVPGALVLTGIVVSVTVTAFFLSLVLRLYKKYGTLQMDEILYMYNKEH